MDEKTTSIARGVALQAKLERIFGQPAGVSVEHADGTTTEIEAV